MYKRSHLKLFFERFLIFKLKVMYKACYMAISVGLLQKITLLITFRKSNAARLRRGILSVSVTLYPHQAVCSACLSNLFLYSSV